MKLTDVPDFIYTLNTYPRIAVTGGPKTGKTSLVAQLVEVLDPRTVIHTDRFKSLPWVDQARAVNEAAADAGARWLMEGVTVARALRHGLPADIVIYMAGPPFETLPTHALSLTRKVAGWVDEVRDRYLIKEVTW